MKVLITGTGKGFGKSLAEYYLNKGNNVIGISRSKNSSLTVNQSYSHLSLDLTNFKLVEKEVSDLLKNNTEIDLVILNAGVLPEIKDIADCSLDDIYKVMDINLWANKVLIDLIAKSNCKVNHIVGVSSGAAVNGSRGWNSYSISKAALNMLFQLYAAEMPSVHFSAIAPGLIDTAMQEYIFSLPDDPKFESILKLKEAKASGQMPSPDEAAILFDKAINFALKFPSGSFHDVRDIF